MIKLAVLGLAALVCVIVCQAAWGQAPKPSYEQALAAVTEAGCERVETARHVRFFCKEGEALWYFTHERQPAHPTYFAARAYLPDPFTVVPDQNFSLDMPIVGGGRSGFASDEAFQEWIASRRDWMRDIFAVWRVDAARMRPRDRGKLYPLDPS